MFCAAYDLAKRHYYVSLRSASDAVDVSAICKALGGGGHKRAGGFTCERLEDVLVFADGSPVGAPAEGAGAKRAKAE
jgi:nanoRNase/pAp phosphatase (c-di-AMP/oligoRNAs hydrolase)